MTRICPHCYKRFETTGPFCSVRCQRAVRRHRQSVIWSSLLAILVLGMALRSAPRHEYRPQPNRRFSLQEIKALAVNEDCPICAGKGRLDCGACLQGKIFYLGTTAACPRCQGRGWTACQICSGTGELAEALSAFAPAGEKVATGIPDQSR